MPCVVSERFDGIGADGAPVRLGIMGGTFDPIHMGHLAVAEEMRAKLDLDAVLFVPAGSPVFKKGQDVTDPRMRVEMCRLAVAGNPHFDVSTIEVDREGDTFTVDTLRELREHFPPNVDLYFIVGSDSAITIGKWRNVAEIAELAHLAVAAGRPGSASKEELEAAIAAAAPFDAHVVNVSSLEISSTALRERLRAGDPCRYVMPESVRTFIRERKLYQSDEGRRTAGDVLAGEPEDALSKEFFKARKKELEKRVSEKRFKHILGVSETCGRLAEEYGVDVRKARLAGLLHDWDKGMNDDEARQRVVELGMIDRIDPYIVEKHHIHKLDAPNGGVRARARASLDSSRRAPGGRTSHDGGRGHVAARHGALRRRRHRAEQEVRSHRRASLVRRDGRLGGTVLQNL